MKNRKIKRAVRSRRTFTEGRRNPATPRIRKEGIAAVESVLCVNKQSAEKSTEHFNPSRRAAS